MLIFNKREPVILFVGDMLFFTLSLFVSLSLRYGKIPSFADFYSHFSAFVAIFIIWAFIFFVAGLYEKYTTILRDKLPSIIFNAQLVNSALAVVFFYLLPSFGIAPKTILFINLVVSFILIYFWRIYSVPMFGFRKKTPALLVSTGQEMRELEEEINNNPRSGLKFISSIDLDKIDGIDFADEIVKRVYSEDVSVVAIDLENAKVGPILPKLYNLIFSKIKFIDMNKIYEDVFDRIPLSIIRHSWFLENITLTHRSFYDSLKRIMDIIAGLILLIIFIVFLPFVAIIIKLDDAGPLFFINKRMGQNNRVINVIKFRSMKVGEGETVTRVGGFLRASRIDELPQTINLISGDLSLVGPRPETPELVSVYEKEIPFYNVRHLIKPGLSGWAQIYQDNPPKFKVNFSDTKTKLSYDLYYIKNRSALLDFKIALKTLKVLFLRSGK